MNDCVKIHPTDSVAVALRPLAVGETVEVDGVAVRMIDAVPAGHKFALVALDAGATVTKYGAPIGHTLAAIPVGGRVDETNLKTNLTDHAEYRYQPGRPATAAAVEAAAGFMGYRRGSGEVGIRNELWLLPTVGCVNGTVTALAETFRRELGDDSGIDAVVAFPHPFGCSQLGDDHAQTREILCDLARHPNAGGVLVVGLGCENNQIETMRGMLADVDSARIRFMETQKVGDEMAEGLRLLRELAARARQDIREPAPLSALRVGLKCGGSDGFSGITANPLLGRFSDFLIAQGGTTVLTEVPEMFGAETLLMNRCADEGLFDQTVALINDFKHYFSSHGQPVYENPSPGNKAGGISTLEEKSLGCTQKSGSAPVRAVLPYAGRITTSGLNLLCAPGNDLVASTALGAAGCQLVLFTTGRGTPFGSFVPTMKLSTNSALPARKPGWIDFDAGTLLEGETFEQALARLVDAVRAVASGHWVNNEKNGFREISIFKTGVTL